MEKLYWSEELTKITKDTLEELLDGMFRGPKCCLKKKTGEERSFGYITNTPQLMSRKDDDEIIINETDGKRTWTYTSVDEIIEDGWAVD
jgi:hypothetical protein